MALPLSPNKLSLCTSTLGQKFPALNMYINVKDNLKVGWRVRLAKFEQETIDFEVFFFCFAKLESKCTIGPARAVGVQNFH